MSSVLRALVREPLVHFVILGASLFALDAATASVEDEPPPAAGGLATPTGPIVVDAALRETLAMQWSKTHATRPSAEEEQRLVDRWIDEEVLYREGLARSLADGDAVVRERVASQMAYVLQSRIVLPEPTEDELRATFATMSSTSGSIDRVDFTQVFVSGTDDAARKRAQELLQLLQGGADPDGLGDTHAGGRRFRGRRITDLATRFGDAFVEGFDTVAEGTWVLRPSGDGFHLVRIDRRTTEPPPAFEKIRDSVLHDWQQARREAAMQQATAELRGRWEIVVTP